MDRMVQTALSSITGLNRLDLLTKKNGAPYGFVLESVEHDGSILGTRVSLILPLPSED